MLILFDHGTPAPLSIFLTGHTVKKAKDMGWDTLSNGDLLKAAEEAGFEILLTTLLVAFINDLPVTNDLCTEFDARTNPKIH
jgi:hypothetical protein